MNSIAIPIDPTRSHSAEFWEKLGRTIGTFGFLEEVLRKAILAFTGKKRYSPDEVDDAYKKWGRELERALTNQLFNLIEQYEKAIRDHPESKISEESLALLIEKLKEACALRNVLCHGSWRLPDSEGKSLPLFVSKRLGVFETKINVAYLEQLRRCLNELATDIMNSVLEMDWEFPGST